MIKFQKDIENLGVRRERDEGQGYIYTWTGRKIPCDEGRVYTLINYLIQGGAAEIFKSNLKWQMSRFKSFCTILNYFWIFCT
jgi:hypothetical protein